MRRTNFLVGMDTVTRAIVPDTRVMIQFLLEPSKRSARKQTVNWRVSKLSRFQKASNGKSMNTTVLRKSARSIANGNRRRAGNLERPKGAKAISSYPHPEAQGAVTMIVGTGPQLSNAVSGPRGPILSLWARSTLFLAW